MVAFAPVTKNLVIAALVGVIAVGGALVYAQSSRTADVEVRVWESTSDPERNYISARPEGGSWSTLGTIPLGRGEASAYETTSNGRFRYSDITLAVPLPDEADAPTVALADVGSFHVRFYTDHDGYTYAEIAVSMLHSSIERGVESISGIAYHVRPGNRSNLYAGYYLTNAELVAGEGSDFLFVDLPNTEEFRKLKPADLFPDPDDFGTSEDISSVELTASNYKHLRVEIDCYRENYYLHDWLPESAVTRSWWVCPSPIRHSLW